MNSIETGDESDASGAAMPHSQPQAAAGARPSIRTIGYGPSADQVGDLYVPDAAHAPVVCLLHGGYWRARWGRDHIAPLAPALRERGFAVWNLEYRRVGGPGGGWPGTLQDIGAGIDHLATMARLSTDLARRLDLQRVIVVGHSAGGQLALWSASGGDGIEPRQPSTVRIAAAVGLAPVADLAWAYAHGCGNGAVKDFLGGSPAEFPGRYRAASPVERLPFGVRQLVIHGTPDEDVPVEISCRYARAAAAAGDDLTFIEPATVMHMDFVDPGSEASRLLFEWLASVHP